MPNDDFLYADAKLESGRVEVGHKIEASSKKHGKIRGLVCETCRIGKDPLRAVIVNKDGMHFLSFENVSPGAKQKTPEKAAAAPTGNPFIDKAKGRA